MIRKHKQPIVLFSVCAVWIFLCSSIVLADSITLKLGHIAPAGRSTHDFSAQRFAEQVGVHTNGRIKVKVFPHGQFGRPGDHWSQLTAGAIDLFIHDLTGSEMVEPKPKNFQVLLAPYLFESPKHYHAFLESSLFGLMMGKIERAANIKYIGYGGDRGPRSFSTTNMKATTPMDIKGLKLRVPPAPPFVAAYTSWGASPTPVPPKSLYSAVKSGMVVGIDIDMVSLHAAKFYEIQKYFVAINWMRSGLGIWMNADRWSSLSLELQEAIMKSAREAGEYTSQKTAEQMATAESGLKKAGVIVIHPDLKPWMDAVQGTIAKNDGSVWEQGLYSKIKALNE